LYIEAFDSGSMFEGSEYSFLDYYALSVAKPKQNAYPIYLALCNSVNIKSLGFGIAYWFVG